MSDDGLEVRGGSAGVAATTEAIHASGAQLLGVAKDVALLVLPATGLGLAPGTVVAAALDPFGSARVHATLATAIAGPDGLAPCGAALVLLGTRVHAAAEAYALADVDAEQALRAIWREASPHLVRNGARALSPVAGWVALGALVGVGGWVAVRGAPVMWDTVGVLREEAQEGDLTWELAVGQGLLGRREVQDRLGSDAEAVALATQEWLARNPWAARELVATVPLVLDAMVPAGVDGVLAAAPITVGGATIDEVPDTASELAALLAGAGLATGLLRQGDVRVTSKGPATPAIAPLTVRDALGRLHPFTPPRDGQPGPGYTPGAIRLDRIEDAAGVRWQLYLPPTQTWSVDGGALPADGTSNLAALGGVESDAVEAAVEVMRAAGVGSSDPVMAVGYSQGGIVAAALASDPAVQDEFAMRQVLTVGSPVSGFDIPPDVQALSIEHGADLVPQLDGDRNPDRAYWATVQRDVLDPQHGLESARSVVDIDPWVGHDFEAYLNTARAVDSSDHPSVRTWRAALVDFAGGGDALVTTQQWQTIRASG